MSVTSSPPEAATRSAISRTFCSSKAIFFSNYACRRRVKPGPTKKWACAHWCASTIPRTTTQQFSCQLYAWEWEKTNRGRGIIREHAGLCNASFVGTHAHSRGLLSAPIRAKDRGQGEEAVHTPIEPGAIDHDATTLGQSSPIANAETKRRWSSDPRRYWFNPSWSRPGGAHVHGARARRFPHFRKRPKSRRSLPSRNSSRAGLLLAVTARPGVFTNPVCRSRQTAGRDDIGARYCKYSVRIIISSPELIKYLARISIRATLGLAVISSKGLKICMVDFLAQHCQADSQNISGESETMQSVDPDVELRRFWATKATSFPDLPLANAQGKLISRQTSDVDNAQFQQEAAIETTMQAFLELRVTLRDSRTKNADWAHWWVPVCPGFTVSCPAGRLSMLYDELCKLSMNQHFHLPVDVRGLSM